MYFEYRQSIVTGDIALDHDIRAIEVVHLDTGSFLLTSTGNNGGVVSYRLGTDGASRGVVDTEYFTQGASLISGAMDAAGSGSSGTVLIAGGVGNGLASYGISSSGMLSAGTAVSGTSASSAITIAPADVGAVYYSVTRSSDEVIRHTSSGNASREAVLEGATALDTVQIGNQHFLLAAQYGGQSISSYRINTNNGALTLADELGAEQGLGIHIPTTFDTLEAFGQTWIILGSAGSSSLSVLELGANGQLTAVDHVLDTLETRFGGVQSVSTVQVGDRVFVVAGGGDDGLSLFTMTPEGLLIHLETIPHTLGAGLENVSEIEATVMGDAIQIFVTSDKEAGVSLFRVDLTDLGEVLHGNGSSVNRLEGTAGDDLLVAEQGDILFGNAGNDILIGALDARLTGGEGADTFVLDETGGRTQILDFTPDEDKLDLSSYFMLRSPDQLSINSSSWGARISIRDTVIEVRSHNGMSLNQEDLFGRVFDWADRIPILERTEDLTPVPVPTPTPQPVPTPQPAPTPTPQPAPTPEPVLPTGMIVVGGNNADRFTGSIANDTLNGGGGNDSLYGGAGGDALVGAQGNDVIEGGADNDWLSGGAGTDILRGGQGNDTATGGDGDDAIGGAQGNDLLRGDGGDDALYGDDGNDTLYGDVGRDGLFGGSGHDLIYGGSGHDTLRGDGENDTLYGNDGSDLIYGGDGHDGVWGHAGNDTLLGNNGDDTLGGSSGNDLLFGGNGSDVIWGSSGEDTGRGGWGDDTLGGGGGRDVLFGDGGDDLVWGGSDGDTLWGGTGVDTVGGFVGDDSLMGDGGDDFIWGNKGHDTLYGGDGNDLLAGGDDADVLMGGNGNDDLRGGTGNDWLSGGWGADSFLFYYNHRGADRIADFNPDVDLIAFTTSSVSYRNLAMRDVGDNVVIYLPNGSITLVDTELSDLSADNFSFG